MAKRSILNGEAVVSEYTKKLILAMRLEYSMREGDVVERMLNGYAKYWYSLYEIPVNSSITPLVTALRNIKYGSGTTHE